MLKCENISADNLINGISFEAVKSKFTAVIGKNGSGKTTLAKCIMGNKKHSGTVLLDGKDISKFSPNECAKKLAYLPQMLITPNISVKELVTLGRTPYTSLFGRLNDCDKASITKAINATDMNGFENRLLTTLSGGEIKRAYLAMLLAQDTDVLLLDEPCAFMDMHAAAEFTVLLKNIDKTLVVIMHDLTLAAKHADNILVLDSGRQVFFGNKQECLDEEIIEKTFLVRRLEKDDETVFTV